MRELAAWLPDKSELETVETAPAEVLVSVARLLYPPSNKPYTETLDCAWAVVIMPRDNTKVVNNFFMLEFSF
jgi:hypothetical protein